MKKRFLVLAANLLLSVSSIFAQQEKGDTEIQISGTYYTSVGTETQLGQGLIQAKLGKYISDHLEIGVAPVLTITTFPTTDPFGNEESEIKGSLGGGAFFVYSFLAGDARTVPYFGGQYFKSDFSDEEDSGSAGINGGIKFFVSEKAAFDFSGNYLFNLNTASEGGALLFVVGVSYLF